MSMAAAAVALALAGCGGSDEPAKPKPASNAGLQVLAPGDLAGAHVPGRPETTTSVSAFGKLSGSGPDDTLTEKELRANGFEAGRFTRFGLASAQDGGFSTAVRFSSAAGAKRDARSGLESAHGRQAIVSGLPAGRYAGVSSGGRVGRNVYFVKGDVSYFVGFSASKAGDPGKRALEAAARRIYARVH
jgi:hypothetical protein